MSKIAVRILVKKEKESKLEQETSDYRLNLQKCSGYYPCMLSGIDEYKCQLFCFKTHFIETKHSILEIKQERKGNLYLFLKPTKELIQRCQCNFFSQQNFIKMFLSVRK